MSGNTGSTGDGRGAGTVASVLIEDDAAAADQVLLAEIDALGVDGSPVETDPRPGVVLGIIAHARPGVRVPDPVVSRGAVRRQGEVLRERVEDVDLHAGEPEHELEGWPEPGSVKWEAVEGIGRPLYAGGRRVMLGAGGQAVTCRVRYMIRCTRWCYEPPAGMDDDQAESEWPVLVVWSWEDE